MGALILKFVRPAVNWKMNQTKGFLAVSSW